MFVPSILPVQAKDIAVTTAVSVAAYLLILSIYRLTVHPFAKYPGPFLAKLTTLYGAYYAYIGDMHLDIERCHQKYGPILRYGPNAILVNSPTGYQDIYGQLKKVKKGPSYAVHGKGNLLGIQDKKYYARLKKIFQQEFSESAMRKYEPKITAQVKTFCDKIAENESSQEGAIGWSSIKDMTQWCNYLTTDVISIVVFSTSWNLLTAVTHRHMTRTMSALVRLIGVLHQSPIFYKLHRVSAMIFFPHLAWSSPQLGKYSVEVIKASNALRERNTDVDDMYGHYRDAKNPDTGEALLTRRETILNSANFIVAGSDTTASALSATFFYLARHPDAYNKVAFEVRSAFSSASEICVGPTLNGCIYLRAAINEAMRMGTVVVQPLWRQTEPGGCIIDGIHVPGGLLVGAGLYSLHHSPVAFPEPFKYDIERWIIHGQNEKEQLQDRERIREMSKSFLPFSTGPRQCIAKNFAQMELMLTMANTFWRLDFKSAEGAAGRVGEGAKGLGWGRERPGEMQAKSYFTAHLKGPMLRFKERDL